MNTPEIKCKTCRYFGVFPPLGRMPGVTMMHRQCTVPRASGSGKPKNDWRHPSESCDRWEALRERT